MVTNNIQIVPQYSQNFSGVLKPWAETRALLCIPRSLSQKAKKNALHIEIYIETVERSDYKMEWSAGLKQSDHGMKWA